jgi:DNA-binding response OmpR family regulator
MSGLQLARVIRRLAVAAAVVLFWVYAEAVDAAELLAAGVKDLVRKPLVPAELHAVIIGYLEGDDSPHAALSGPSES